MLGPTPPWIITLSFLIGFASSAGATERKLEPGEVDASAFRDSLDVFTDGAGHYVTMVSFETLTEGVKVGEHLYYGDGERFYGQRVRSGGSDSQQRRVSRSFWEPRGGASFGGKGDAFVLTCDDRKVTFTPLGEAARKATLKKARFFPHLWKRHAYTLARDDEGTYYYVDRALEPAENFDFNLYRGTRGDMKPMALVNIVSDSEGDIFASKRGRLRLVVNQGSGRRQRTWEWISGKKRRSLTDVPVERNTMLIYRDLGVYDGKRLGTPCDDL